MSTNFNTQTANGEYRLQFETGNEDHYQIMQKVARKCVDNQTPVVVMMDLKDTRDLMCSEDYKERFKAEYYQTKIRYEKLKSFNTKIEAAKQVMYGIDKIRCPMPAHDCPDDLLRDQQSVMGHYLHILEVRAMLEGIDL